MCPFEGKGGCFWGKSRQRSCNINEGAVWRSMSEAGGIDLLLFLFLITAQTIGKPDGNRTVIEAIIHIEVLAFEANCRSRRTGVEEVIGMNRNRCPVFQEAVFCRKIQIE